MTRRTALTLCCLGLLSVPAFARDEQKLPACCAKKGTKRRAGGAAKLRCSLTGKEVDTCCCEPREGGRMHCTLAKKDVDKCCCSEVKAEEKKARRS